MESPTIPISGRRSLYRGFAAARSSDAELKFIDENDIDSRAILLLEEIDRFRHKDDHDDGIVESSMLQQVEQTFAAEDYLLALEFEVDRLLLRQATTKRYRNPATNYLESQNDKRCRACNSNPCSWSPYCDTDALAKRRKALFREMKSVDDHTKKKITDEIQIIGVKIKLSTVDKELHDVYAANDDEAITIKSIHGFPVTLNRLDAIAALEHEHNRHVGSITAQKVVDGILSWMLDGWYFGKYSQPSSSLSNPPASFVNEGSLFEKANDIQMHSNAVALNSSARKEENRAKLASMATTTKYALFCITFSYFRALHLVRQQKVAFSLSRSKPQLSDERMKMIQEHKNCVDRQQRIDYFMRKARVGEERKWQRVELERFEKERISQFTDMNRLAMQRLASNVQRVYRGYLGRKIVEQLKIDEEAVKSAEVFLNECATEIGRAWRGYCGRRDAERLRRDMAEFLFVLREQEAKTEEEEFAIQSSSERLPEL